MPASKWDYGTIKQLTDALQSRRISASALVEHTIKRIEAFDARLNAVVVRTSNARAKRRVRPTLRCLKGSGGPC
jgi:Asp-tRNA(Asn)/Glu-tRNA(Gln) amidotransferase A subunit family amidase